MYHLNFFSEFGTYEAETIEKVIQTAPSKSCSLDPIPTNILKEFQPELLPFITRMCNMSLQEGYLPTSQRQAIVTPQAIKKSGSDASEIKNYWPISNMTFLSKVIERLVCKPHVAYLEANNLLPRYQSAYRCHHSTETTVLKIISHALYSAKQDEVTLLGF